MIGRSYFLQSLLGMSRDYRRDARALNSEGVGFTYGAKSLTRYEDDSPIKQTLPPVTDPSYIELVRIALCYYIAKVDGVSPDEQAIIDEMCEKLLDNPDTNPDYRTELRLILADKGTSFGNVRRYLNRIAPDDLEQFKADVIRIAEATDGITDNERKALAVFQNYIASTKKPVEDDWEGLNTGRRTRIVALKCESCGANLEIDTLKEQALCPYCGSNHLIERA